MSTSPTTRNYLDEEMPIDAGRIAYFQGRLSNRIHSFLLEKFMEAERYGLTKAKLARRIGTDTASINRWLNAPSNLTLYTISNLLLGICDEELDPVSSAVSDARRNDHSSLWAGGDDGQSVRIDAPPTVDHGRNRFAGTDDNARMELIG